MDKEEFIEKALQANQEALKEAKLSDITDKDSTFYKSDTPSPEHVSVSPQDQVRQTDEIPRIRTFNADVQEAVNEEGLSLSKISLAESKKKESSAQDVPTQKNWFMIISIGLASMLILGGISAIGYVWFQKNKPPVETNSGIQENTLIRIEETKDISIKNISRQSIQSEVQKEKKLPPAQNGIREMRFYLENDLQKELLSLSSFFETLESKTPDTLLRNLDTFLFGIHFIGGEPHSFLLLKGESFEILYPSMISYEIDILNDLFPLFDTNSKEPKGFSDVTIQNKDVRAVVDENNLPLFFYHVLEDGTIILTDNIKTFEEILRRLREKK